MWNENTPKGAKVEIRNDDVTLQLPDGTTAFRYTPRSEYKRALQQVPKPWPWPVSGYAIISRDLVFTGEILNLHEVLKRARDQGASYRITKPLFMGNGDHSTQTCDILIEGIREAMSILSGLQQGGYHIGSPEYTQDMQEIQAVIRDVITAFQDATG